MRYIKILTLSILAIIFAAESLSAQMSASELFKEYAMSLMTDSATNQTNTSKTNTDTLTIPLAIDVTKAINDSLAILDSLMREENRYYIPDSQIRLTEQLERQIFQGDSILKVMAEQLLPYRGPRELNDIMRYYNRYDIMKRRVHPRPAQIPDSIDSEYPAANPLFMPLVFNAFKEDLEVPELDMENLMAIGGPADNEPHLSDMEYIDQLRGKIIRSIERHHIDQFSYCIQDIPKYERIEILLEAKKPIMVDNRPSLDIKHISHDPVHRFDPEYTYWQVRGRMTAQMTQTYISQNWSSGGESNMSGLYSIYWKANYNDKKNIQFDNFIDWKVGINTNDADTLRGYNISTDQLQVVSKLGIKAVKNWYYSAQAEFITQTLTNYKTNTHTPKSALLSPAKLFVSVGMDFKKTSKNNQHKISVLMTPLTYRMNFLMDTINFEPSKYGIDEGKRIGHEFGFKVTANYDWKISEDISWNSYLYYYSDFTYIDSEWKNTINFKVNQYLSTQLFIHTKLNDRSFKREEGKRLIQLKEFLSFGFTYFW